MVFSAGFVERAAQIINERTERLVLDLRGLTFLDVAGARALAEATRLAPSGCPVIIRSLNARVRRILDLLELDLRRQPSTSPEHHGVPAKPREHASPVRKDLVGTPS